MPRGDKSAYTSKQKRQAEHIEEGYENRGTPKKEAERRAWATVNKQTGGGKKSGSGRGKTVDQSSARKGGRKDGRLTSLPVRIPLPRRKAHEPGLVKQKQNRPPGAPPGRERQSSFWPTLVSGSFTE